MLVAYPSWRNNYNNFGIVIWDCLALHTAQFTKTAAELLGLSLSTKRSTVYYAPPCLHVKIASLNLVIEWIHVGVKNQPV